MLENEKFTIECPSCRKELSYTLGQLQQGKITNCPHCGKEIQIEESQSGSIQELEDDIKKDIDNIPKKITIKG